MKITRTQLSRIVKEEATRLHEAASKLPRKNAARQSTKDPVQAAANDCIDELLDEENVMQFVDYEGDKVLSRSGVTPEQVEAVREEAIDALMEALKPALREKFAPFIDNLFYLL